MHRRDTMLRYDYGLFRSSNITFAISKIRNYKLSRSLLSQFNYSEDKKTSEL